MTYTKGLCCISNILKDTHKLSYKHVTRKKFLDVLSSTGKSKTSVYLGDITRHNIEVFQQIVNHCDTNKWNYRMPLLIPLVTLPINDSHEIFKYSKLLLIASRQAFRIRLSMHPDQYCVLASDKISVRSKSIFEIEEHAFQLMSLTNNTENYATPINVHLNTNQGSPEEIKNRFFASYDSLSYCAKSQLVLENEDKGMWNTENLVKHFGKHIPITFDYLHHRCNPGRLTEKEAFEMCVETWHSKKAKPLFHYSESIVGDKNPRKHADMPTCTPYDYGYDIDLDYEFKNKDYALQQADVLCLHSSKT